MGPVSDMVNLATSDMLSLLSSRAAFADNGTLVHPSTQLSFVQLNSQPGALGQLWWPSTVTKL
jgi:hypothetical protein